ncbi:ribosome small subunit-dependent GTPase A [Rhodohalobacter mucosus]|uniref:Small ribosomal subunit biogenesis GTPase RsgA n=1 Tax=Rhodohalobacter mucosus TaxID=2079485 RepID=A0A316TVD8_9BACT|nr:ribosome small subunit-dependent GTPase A [Rhodohalobacter mucosus]PWN07065.1 ribosome small subunit-dependent GTPase A [Rhodohalobacter mucosus]
MSKQGRVIQSTGKWYKVAEKDGDTIYDCRLPGRFRLDKKEVTNPVAVGDNVTFTVESDGAGTITEIHERENYIPRQATHGRRGEQILAANIDRAWVVQSVRQPKLNLGFIDRFLVTCEAYEIPAGIIVNKMDLAKKGDEAFVEDIRELYIGLGYSFLTTSIHNEESISRLEKELKAKTSVFIGPSGTGKTSLLNAVQPNLGLRTGEVSGYSNKGKHTTTFATLIPVSERGYIVDTPGIRELGLVNIEKSELSLFFPEMLEPREHCKYYNCTHTHEPGCGVVKAFEEGRIDPDRYNSYINILQSLD